MSDALPIGARLGGFVLGAALGEGGSAVVYAGTRGDLQVALKVLRPGARRSPAQRAHFIAEPEIMRAVGPDNVPVTYGVVEDPRCVAYAMERLCGETLADRMARGGPIDIATAARALAALSACLRRAHARGIVHRDVKPENVFLARDGRVLLLDWGIAHAPWLDRRHTLFDGEVFAGTPAFMAPEARRGESLAAPSQDLWALGATMYEALTGALPLAEHVLVQGDVIAPHTLRPEVSLSLSRQVMRLLDPCPARRGLDPVEKVTPPPERPAPDTALDSMTPVSLSRGSTASLLSGMSPLLAFALLAFTLRAVWEESVAPRPAHAVSVNVAAARAPAHARADTSAMSAPRGGPAAERTPPVPAQRGNRRRRCNTPRHGAIIPHGGGPPRAARHPRRH